MKNTILFCFLLLSFACSQNVFAAGVSSPSTDSLENIYVLKVAKFNNKACQFDGKGMSFQTRMKGLDTLLHPGEYVMAIIDPNYVNLAEENIDSFRLWINGICYPAIKPSFVNRTNSALIFKIDVDTAKGSPWQLFYSFPNYWKFQRIASMNIGTLKKEFKVKHCMKVKLKTTKPWMLFVGYGLFLFIIVAILVFCRGIIRDVGVYTQKGVSISYDRRKATNEEFNRIYIGDIPFSIARSQFLFWLLIIFLGIIHIWGIRDIMSEPTGTVLILLGISGGTFFFGKIIDISKDSTDEPTGSAYVKKFIDEDLKSKGFIRDILSDGKSISLHRLQLFMFTLLLGIFFLSEVLFYLTLPQFSETMMTLMGISSGTYAGIKTTE